MISTPIEKKTKKNPLKAHVHFTILINVHDLPYNYYKSLDVSYTRKKQGTP
jgi:hypothetical protein